MTFHASIVHFRDHANPQQSASGSRPALQTIPRHGFGSLLLAAPKLVPIISKNSISTMKETITKTGYSQI
jgi:hypothetical protein